MSAARRRQACERRARRVRIAVRAGPSIERRKVETHQNDFSSGSELPADAAARMAAPSRSWTCWCLLRRSLLASFQCCGEGRSGSARARSLRSASGGGGPRCAPARGEESQHAVHERRERRRKAGRTQRCLVKQVEWRYTCSRTARGSVRAPLVYRARRVDDAPCCTSRTRTSGPCPCACPLSARRGRARRPRRAPHRRGCGRAQALGPAARRTRSSRGCRR